LERTITENLEKWENTKTQIERKNV